MVHNQLSALDYNSELQVEKQVGKRLVQDDSYRSIRV